MKRLLTSCFGLGRLPIAPGTWGSLPVVIVFGLMCYLGVSGIATSTVMGLIVVSASVICIVFSPERIETTGEKDPQEIVADEVAGQAITFIGAYSTGCTAVLFISAVGFAAFRFFDILKPFPCRQLEKLPKGWGILADDLMAGVYGAIVLQICIRL